MNKNKRKINSISEARKGTQEAPKMSKHDPKLAPQKGFLFEFWSFRIHFAWKWASLLSVAQVSPSNLHDKPTPTKCTIIR